MQFGLRSLIVGAVTAGAMLGINILANGWPFPWKMNADPPFESLMVDAQPHYKIWDLIIALLVSFIGVRLTEYFSQRRDL